ncbi:MAG: 2-oxo-4-hydroxy-4-carboxy-5-ureidoimidazoline decarboxylase [Ferruginibacter sp.]
MTLNAFNTLPQREAADQLKICCGAEKWVKEMMQSFPFSDEQSLVKRAADCWYNTCTEADWREAFTHHPKIGDVRSLTEKFASTQHLAGDEQASVNKASASVIEGLAEANKAYESKFGFIFIVCAAGRSAEEMLRLLNDRLNNNVDEELQIAMGEQFKITVLRFKKIITDGDWSAIKGSRLTTHVLDTSLGKPGAGITVRLRKKTGNAWQTFAQGITDSDGRVSDLLPPQRKLDPETYKIVFETAAYFETLKIKGFYPEVEIQFSVVDDSHYHVPLLINPFGYSTYRGS